MPRIRREGRQRPDPPGFVAAGVVGVVLPGRNKGAANRCPPFVDAAVYVDTDFPHESDAAGGMVLGALHGDKAVVDLHCEVGGNPTQSDLVGFAPIKRCPVKRTTGTALQTRIVVYCCTSGIG